MKFFILTYALASTLIYISEAFVYNEELQPHEGEETECSGRYKDIADIMMSVRCIPKQTLVKLIPVSGYEFYPNMVSVKRCSGSCFNNKSCMATKSTFRRFLVKRNEIRSSLAMKCYEAVVEEHLKCKCQCIIKENDCNDQQIYDEDDCACKCKNMKELFKCQQIEGMRWDKEACKCICDKSQEECSTGLLWVPDLCRCAKVMDMSNNLIESTISVI